MGIIHRLPTPPAGVDLTVNLSAQVIAAAAVTWSLAVVAVVLRVVSRKFKDNRLWMDDWLIFFALVGFFLLTQPGVDIDMDSDC